MINAGYHVPIISVCLSLCAESCINKKLFLPLYSKNRDTLCLR